jgi:hypothetical protein
MRVVSFGAASGDPSSGFSRYVRGMIVKNQFDGGAGRIGGTKKLEEFDELSTAVAVSDQGMNLAGEQINCKRLSGTLTLMA